MHISHKNCISLCRLLFKDGKFPEGEFQSYKDDNLQVEAVVILSYSFFLPVCDRHQPASAALQPTCLAGVAAGYAQAFPVLPLMGCAGLRQIFCHLVTPCLQRETNAEKREQERMLNAGMLNSVRQAAEVHRQVQMRGMPGTYG